MAARATWKGSIRLSLITIPIRVFPATKASDVSFRQLHRKCHTPIQLRKWCPHCEREVNADEIVKGYESSKGHFVLVETEEIEKLRPESTHVIDIGYTVSAAAIDPKDDAILMYTLRTAGEVVDVRQIDQLDFAAGRVKPEEVKLAKQILQHFDTAPDLSAFTDHYQQALRALLKSKGPAEAISAQAGAEAGKPKKVVDLMDALRKSLAEVTAKGHKARIPARRVRARAS